MIRRLFSLLRDSTGTAVIELGLFAPILAAMLVGAIELGTAYSEKLRLEQVAHRVVERVQQTSFKTSMEAILEAEAAATAGEGSQANLTWWIECDGIKISDPSTFDTGCSSGQVFARYVQLEIRKDYAPILPLWFLQRNGSGAIELQGIAGIRIQ